MPGSKSAAEAQGPGASLRSFLLLGRSPFLGVAVAGQVVIKGESEIDTTGLIFNSNQQEAPKLAPDSVLEGQTDGKVGGTG